MSRNGKWDFSTADALFEGGGQRRDEILEPKATGRAPNTDRTGQSYQVQLGEIELRPIQIN